MCHPFLTDPSLYTFLLECDRELAAEAQADGCACGGRLHVSHYTRQPRGVPDGLPDAYPLRFSFCCDRCRRRTTPRSLRYFGRRLYPAAIFLLISALQLGCPSDLRRFQRAYDLDRRTLARWRAWWNERFARCVFWQILRARFRRPPDRDRLPSALLAGSSGTFLQRLLSTLRLLGPLTVGSPSLDSHAM